MESNRCIIAFMCVKQSGEKCIYQDLDENGVCHYYEKYGNLCMSLEAKKDSYEYDKLIRASTKTKEKNLTQHMVCVEA